MPSRRLQLAEPVQDLHCESSGSELAARLRKRAQDLQTMASELLQMAHTLDDNAHDRPALVALAQPGWLDEARRIYRNRRLRADVFGTETLFGEPAWDLLLDLFIASFEGKATPVTSACIGSAVPTTTALRWLSVLEARGLVIRQADPQDARRVFVRLSDGGMTRMLDYFERSTLHEAQSGSRRPDNERRLIRSSTG